MKNLPCKGGDEGSVPGRRTKIPCAVEQLSPSAEAAEARGPGAHGPRLLSPQGTARTLCGATREPAGCDRVLHPPLRPAAAQRVNTVNIKQGRRRGTAWSGGLGVITPKRASLAAQLVKNPPAVWETWVPSLCSEDPLEKGKAAHSRTLAWRIPRAV